MKKRTEELRNKLLQFEDTEERIKLLKDSYKGETAYIVAGGPSLNNYTSEHLNEFFKDKLTLPIKQSWNMLREVADFHLLNFCNFAEYNWSGNKSIITWAIFEQFHPEMIFQNNLECDIMIPIYRNNGRMEETIAEAGDFESMLIQKSFARPWGPGCMYELAIPLAVYSGCKKIVTVGWDIGDLDKTEENKSMFQEHFYGGEDTVEFGVTQTSHREITSVANSTKGIFYFLKDLGIDWEMSSDRNPGYKGIRRIKL